MRLTLCRLLPRVFLNSPLDTFQRPPKAHRWWKRQRIFQFTAWSYDDERDRYRRAIRRVQKIWLFETEKNRDEPRYKRHAGQERIEAALEPYDIPYKHFMNILNNAKIVLTPEMLSTLAIYEPKSFESLVMLTKKLALDEGRTNVRDNKDMDNIHPRGQLSDGPLPRAIEYPKRLSQDIKEAIKPLPRSEFEY